MSGRALWVLFCCKVSTLGGRSPSWCSLARTPLRSSTCFMTARSLRSTGSMRELWSWRALSRSEIPDALIFSPLVVQFEAFLRKRLIESVAHEEKHPCEIETASWVGLVNRRLGHHGSWCTHVSGLDGCHTAIHIVIHTMVFSEKWYALVTGIYMHIGCSAWVVRAVEGVLKLCTSHSPVRNIEEY